MTNRVREERSTFDRKETSVSLNPEDVAEARELGIDLSEACERGLRQALKEARGTRWLEENREALDSYNRYVEENGLPLAKYRQF